MQIRIGFLAYTVFIILPIIYVIYLSVFEWSGLGEMNFIGMENFKTLFTNTRIAPVFFNALKKIFNPTIGFLNTFFEKMGWNNLVSAWVGNPKLAFKIMIALVLWQGAASGMMIFYANMMDIPSDIIEASRIDGCSEAQRLFRILIPLSLPACSSIIVMSSIWAPGVFDIPFMLGGPTGGVNSSLDFVNMVFYRYTFGSVLGGEVNLGFGASISVTMFIIIMIVTFIQNKVLTKFEYDT